MPRYRCCFVGKRGEVLGVEMFDARADSDACARAEELVARVGYHAVEVWSQDEMIYRAPDIWRAANLVVSGDGIHAAAERAGELLAAGDVEGCAVWPRILVTVAEQLARTTPAEGERVN